MTNTSGFACHAAPRAQFYHRGMWGMAPNGDPIEIPNEPPQHDPAPQPNPNPAPIGDPPMPAPYQPEPIDVPPGTTPEAPPRLGPAAACTRH
jgi:hypothetical protein